MESERKGNGLDRNVKLIRLNDVEIVMQPCGHCGLQPTETDAQAAIAAIHVSSNLKCGACGEMFKLKRVQLLHASAHDNGPIWRGIVGDSEPHYTIMALGSLGSERWIFLHGACAKTALPFVTWKGLESDEDFSFGPNEKEG